MSSLCLLLLVITTVSPTFVLGPPVEPYDVYLDTFIEMPPDDIINAMWKPDSAVFPTRGRRVNHILGIYNYTSTPTVYELPYYPYLHRYLRHFSCINTCQVQMHKKGWPSDADQSQTHVTRVRTPGLIVQFVTIRTSNYPYSETFNVRQVWTFRAIPGTNRTQVRLESKLEWTNPPSLVIQPYIKERARCH